MCDQTYRAGKFGSVAIEGAFPDNVTQISKNKRYYSVASTLSGSATTGRTTLRADTSAKHEAGAEASPACGTSTLDDSKTDRILAVTQLRPSSTLKLSESAEIECGSKLLDLPQTYRQSFNSTVLQHGPISNPRQVAIGKHLNGMSLQDNHSVCKLQEVELERQEYLSLSGLADIQREDDFRPSLKAVDEELGHINDKFASTPTTPARDNDLLSLMRKLLAKQDSPKITTNKREPAQLSEKLTDLAVVNGTSREADPISNLDITSQISQALQNRSAPSPIPERYSSRKNQRLNKSTGENQSSRDEISYVGKRKLQHKRPGLSKVEAAGRAFSKSESAAGLGSGGTFLKGTSIIQDVQSPPLIAAEDHSSELGTSLGSASVGQDSVACALFHAAAGERMYKYVRWSRVDLVHCDANGRTNDTCADSVGLIPRHKRWVWINPSERTISWSRKPFNTGVSLRRHRVRNCTFSHAKDLK